MTAIIIIPRRHYTQPQGRVTIAPEWLKDIRSRAWLPADPQLPGDLEQGFWTGNLPTGTTTPSGTASLFDGGQFLRQQQSQGKTALFAPPLMLVARCATHSVAAGERYVCGVGKYTRAFDLCRIGQNGANLFAQFRQDAGGAQAKVTGTGQAVVGQEMTLVYRLGGPNETSTFWIDGRSIGQATMPSTVDLGAELFSVGIGHPGETSLQRWIGTVSMAGFLLGDYTDAQAQALSANPWQLFRADPVRIYSLPSVIPTLSGLTTSNITQTGARHSLTLTF